MKKVAHDAPKKGAVAGEKGSKVEGDVEDLGAPVVKGDEKKAGSATDAAKKTKKDTTIPAAVKGDETPHMETQKKKMKRMTMKTKTIQNERRNGRRKKKNLRTKKKIQESFNGTKTAMPWNNKMEITCSRKKKKELAAAH